MKNNTLPNFTLRYPKNGVFSTGDGDVDAECGISLAGERRRKLFRSTDTANTVLNVVAEGVLLITANFFPGAFHFILG